MITLTFMEFIGLKNRLVSTYLIFAVFFRSIAQNTCASTGHLKLTRYLCNINSSVPNVSSSLNDSKSFAAFIKTFFGHWPNIFWNVYLRRRNSFAHTTFNFFLNFFRWLPFSGRFLVWLQTSPWGWLPSQQLFWSNAKQSTDDKGEGVW